MATSEQQESRVAKLLRNPLLIGLALLTAVATAFQVAGVTTMLLAKVILAGGVWIFLTVELWCSPWIKDTGLYARSIVLLASTLSGLLALELTSVIATLKLQQLSQSSIVLAVSLINASNPAIVVENNSDNLADAVRWELVMFRKSDLAFFSYVSQNIGYLKAHTRGTPYSMDLNALPHAPGSEEIPGGGQINQGDNLIGTLAVDCALCKGTTVIVSFVWGVGGWFYELPDGNGRLLLPKMTKQGVTQFVQVLDTMSSGKRQIISH